MLHFTEVQQAVNDTLPREVKTQKFIGKEAVSSGSSVSI